MVSISLYPLISKPTRITSTTATLTDNIFTNNLQHCMNSGIFYSDLSDHLPIVQVTHLKLDAETPFRKRLARLINSATIAAASKVPSTQFSHKDFLVGHFADCFFLNTTSPAEVASIVQSKK